MADGCFYVATLLDYCYLLSGDWAVGNIQINMGSFFYKIMTELSYSGIVGAIGRGVI